MICPLMSSPKVFGASAEGFTPCQEQKCAWWVDQQAGCAMLLSAQDKVAQGKETK